VSCSIARGNEWDNAESSTSSGFDVFGCIPVIDPHLVSLAGTGDSWCPASVEGCGSAAISASCPRTVRIKPRAIAAMCNRASSTLSPFPGRSDVLVLSLRHSGRARTVVPAPTVYAVLMSRSTIVVALKRPAPAPSRPPLLKRETHPRMLNSLRHPNSRVGGTVLRYAPDGKTHGVFRFSTTMGAAMAAMTYSSEQTTGRRIASR